MHPVLLYTTHQMPPVPTLFTSVDVDSKALRRRMDTWIDKTFYVLKRMNEGGYCRMGKPEALEMVEKMAERMSGLVVTYRHLLDPHVLASYIHHLSRLSNYLLAPQHLLRTHALLFSDLYSKAYLCVDRMTPANVSQILTSYDVFRSEVKSIHFKVHRSKYPERMNHVGFIRKLLRRLDQTMHLALPSHLLAAAVSLHTIDSNLTEVADRVFDLLLERFRIESAPLESITELLYCIGLWGMAHHTNRSEAVGSLVARVDAASEDEIKKLSSNAFGKLLYGFGRLKLTEHSAIAERTQIWFGERFNGYEMLPRDLARSAYGYAFAGARDSNLAYLLTKQAIRRAGHFRGRDLQLLREAFDRMDVDFGRELEQQLLSGDKRFFERVYGHR